MGPKYGGRLKNFMYPDQTVPWSLTCKGVCIKYWFILFRGIIRNIVDLVDIHYMICMIYMYIA